VADVKQAAIALGNVYRRAADARLRLAAKLTTVRARLRRARFAHIAFFRSLALAWARLLRVGATLRAVLR
jgi:hypothetical protein